MSVDPKSGGAGWEDKLHDASSRVEDELRKVISYINDEVVPEVRKNGSAALRSAAQELEKLAQKMDEQRGGRSSSSKDGAK